jgi:hypothetical protein
MGIKLKGKKCEQCGTDNYHILTQHRIMPGWVGGTHHPANVEILCKSCHALAHLESQTRKVEVALVIKHSTKYLDKDTDRILGYKSWVYPLHWYRLEFEDTKDGCWFGVCGCSGRTFDFETHPLMNIFCFTTNDVIISEKEGCECKLRCLVTKCKYNKTNLESYASHKRLKEEELAWLRGNWNRITNLRPMRALCRSLGIPPHR